MKTDGLKNPSVCFCVISDDGGPPKYVGSLINGIFFNSVLVRTSDNVCMGFILSCVFVE
jgi:hypothetical protein